jgi:hypothetical protein
MHLVSKDFKLYMIVFDGLAIGVQWMNSVVLVFCFIGLLAMTIDNEDDARELYRSSLAVLSETLNSGTETLKVSYTRCSLFL